MTTFFHICCPEGVELTDQERPESTENLEITPCLSQFGRRAIYTKFRLKRYC